MALKRKFVPHRPNFFFIFHTCTSPLSTAVWYSSCLVSECPRLALQSILCSILGYISDQRDFISLYTKNAGQRILALNSELRLVYYSICKTNQFKKNGKKKPSSKNRTTIFQNRICAKFVDWALYDYLCSLQPLKFIFYSPRSNISQLRLWQVIHSAVYYCWYSFTNWLAITSLCISLVPS